MNKTYPKRIKLDLSNYSLYFLLWFSKFLLKKLFIQNFYQKHLKPNIYQLKILNHFNNFQYFDYKFDFLYC